MSLWFRASVFLALLTVTGTANATSSGTISAVVDGWGNHVAYVLDANGFVWQLDGTGWQGFGGPASQLSAGLDANGRAQVFAIIGPDLHPWVRNWIGWRQLDPDIVVNQLSGTTHNQLYIRDQNDGVRLWNGFYFEDPLGGPVSQVSAGVNNFGRDNVYGLGYDSVCYVNNGFGWNSLGGSWTQISGTVRYEVYAVDANSLPWINASSTLNDWQALGGAVTQISAGLDAFGRDELFAIIGPGNGIPPDLEGTLFVRDMVGWHELTVSNLDGTKDGLTRGVRGNSVHAYVTEISGMAQNSVFAVAEDGTYWQNISRVWYGYGAPGALPSQ